MTQQRGSSILSAIIATALVLLLAVVVFVLVQGSRVKLTTPYHAVFLDSGQGYFGKLASNILVKRGKEWHGPDRMIINNRHVVLVEPVSESSKVSQLISEMKK